MKTKNRIWIYSLAIMGVLLMLTNSCNKDENSDNNPILKVTTTAITSIAANTATSGGNVTSDGGENVTARGICWEKSSNPTINGNKTLDGAGTGIFSSEMTGLKPSTLYYVRAYATNSIGTTYGEELSFTTGIGIGSSYLGGIIAYILQTGDPGYDASVQHGLIAAPSDISTASILWWNGSNVTTGATGTALGTGNANTNAIVSAQGAGNYAAKMCYDLVLNGYSDWYLPSKDELHKLFLNKLAIGSYFHSCYYWSSSEYSNSEAWYEYLGSGYQNHGIKNDPNYVRAVRSF